MGAGKSTLGKKLAQLLHHAFADLDKTIEQGEGKSITNLFQDHGEDHFRQLESLYLNQLLTSPGPLVVALGGGTVCFNQWHEKLTRAGILIYLEMPASALVRRLRQKKQERPLIKEKTEQELLVYIQQTLTQREPFYKAAQLQIPALHLTPQLLLHAILDYTEKNKT